MSAKHGSEVLLKPVFEGKTILITGGAGSIGSALARSLAKYKPTSIRVFDNNEHALSKMKRNTKDPCFRFLLGDVKDMDRLEMAVADAQIVFHLAAVKDISISEYNPIETIKTNILGTINLIECAMRHPPMIFTFISSDKAANAQTLYGATKMLGERLTLWAHLASYPKTVYNVVRFGNVMESKGNVFEIWKEQGERGDPLTVTDPEMKRYMFHVEEAVKAIETAAQEAPSGTILVPKMPEVQIKDLISGIISGINDTITIHELLHNRVKITGPRKDEKMREELMTEDEKKKAEDYGGWWIIKP